jgi:hypothetical protein
MIYFAKLSLFFILSVLTIADVRSEIFHVALHGNDASGTGSELAPWRTPEYGAKQLVLAGDTLLIHAGTYTLNSGNLPPEHNSMGRWRGLVSPPEDVSGTSGNPITIKAYPGDTVLLDAGSSPQWPAVGTNLGDYLVVDGFSVRGAAILWGTTGSVIKNCNLYGGIDTPISNGGDNFGAVLRLENCTDCIVQYNLLHDNQVGITLANSPLIIEYDSTNLIIENNDIFNSVGIGIRLKDDPESVTIRFNHIYDNTLSGIQGANQGQGNDIYIHHNVIRNNNTSNNADDGGIKGLVLLRNWEIYNNTFSENNGSDIRILYNSANDMKFWNNIHHQSNYYYRTGFSSTGASFSDVITYSDYNTFHNSGNWQSLNTSFNNLSNFSSNTGHDASSVISNPGFIFAGGTNAEDYKRTSYTINGRGGAYESVMGAYVTGFELIGSGRRPKSPFLNPID